MNGIERIAAERKRQIEEEGWTAKHDDRHIRGEMASLAALYALPTRDQSAARALFYPPTWGHEWWKPSTSRIRDLERAGALIAAEIDRLLRRGM